MKRTLSCFLLYTILTVSNAQYPNWHQYSAGDYVLCQAFENDDILWIGTYNGLFRLTISTGDVVSYNTANSPMTSNIVRAMAIDENNNKWIGTWRDGLMKFDNDSWTIYDTANSGLPAMGFMDMKVDSENKIWMIVYCLDLSTIGSVVCYDGSDWTIYNSQNSGIPGTSYLSLDIDNYDTVWIGSYYEGLVKFDGQTWTVYNEENSDIPDDHIYAVYIDSDNTKWIGTSQGMAEFDGSNWTVYTTWSGFPYPVIRSINRDENKTLWISSNTFNSGGISYHCLVSRDTNNVWTVYDQGNSGLPHDCIKQISISDNIKWFGTYNGIASFNDIEWEVVELGCGIPDERIYSLASDNIGNIWSVSLSGLTKFDGNNWEIYHSGNSLLPVNDINAVETHTDNRVYVCTEGGGLVVIENEEWLVFNTANSSLPNDTVNCCVHDQNGYLWIGTNFGLAKYSGNIWIKHYYTGNSGLPSNEIKTVVVDDDEVVWLSSDGKIVSYDGNNWDIHTFMTGTPIYNDVISMAVDHDNVKWFGTFQYGVISFDGSNWSSHPALPSFFNIAIEVDEDNTKWFGAAGGLFAYKTPNNYHVYTVYNSGLSGKDVYSITIDANNTKWIGTRDNGISIYNENGFPTSVNEYDFIDKDMNQLTNFPNPFSDKITIQVNLPIELMVNIDIYHLNGTFVTQLFSGRMKNGINTFTWNGNDINKNVIKQGVYLVSLSVNGQSILSKKIMKY